MPSLPSFAKELPDGRRAYYLDNHLLSTFNSCPRKFELQHIKNLRIRGAGMGGAMKIGIWWSTCLEYYYQGIQDHQQKGSPLPNIELCAALAWRDEEMEVWKETGPSALKAYDKFKGQGGALVMAQQYRERYEELDLRHWKIISMELGFGLNNEVLVGENDRIQLYWCGRPDLVVLDTSSDQLFSPDHKTVDYIKGDFQVKWKPHPQTAGYTFAIDALAKGLGIDRHCDRTLINGAARQWTEKPRDGKPKPRFVRVPVPYSPDEITEWRRMTFDKALELDNALETNNFLWRESSCHLYSGCPYRGIDSVAPGSRHIVEESAYVQAEPWTPYRQGEEGEEVTDES